MLINSLGFDLSGGNSLMLQNLSLNRNVSTVDGIFFFLTELVTMAFM